MSAPQASVVVVHGLWMPGTETALMRRRLQAAGFATRLFRYRSVMHGLTANATRLAEFLALVPGDTVHMIGHSLGGVLILEALAQQPFAREGRVVCLGSPLAGSCTADVLAGSRAGRWVIGRCMLDMLERGGLRECDVPREVGIIAGNSPVGFGRLVGGLIGPNDGTVAVEETRLPGAADHIVLPASHFSLLWSMEVHRQILCFLEHGRFRHDAA
jgi:hypothetical protein